MEGDLQPIHEVPVGARIMAIRSGAGISFPLHLSDPLAAAVACVVVAHDEWGTSVALDGRHFGVDAARHRLVRVIPEHHPVCGHCGELWPCGAKRIDQEVARAAWELADLCAHCGQPINGAWSTSFGGRRWHIAKKYRGPDGTPCRLAAERARQEIHRTKETTDGE